MIRLDRDKIGEAGSQTILAEAAEILRRGGLVIFPTETVYGLGGNATDPAAAKAIYAAKGRPADNPLIIHIEKPEDAGTYTYTNDTYRRIAEAFMPGPITVILRARDNIPVETRAGLPTVAVRCPKDEIARALIGKCGFPIAAPSANLSGSPSPTNARHVADDMNGRVDMIIDGGECEIGLESTIVKIEEDGSLTLLRPGRITPEELRAAVGQVRIASAVTAELRPGEVALSPGMKYRHYAPKSPVILLDGSLAACVDFIRREGKSNAAAIAYSEDVEILRAAFPELTVYAFGEKGDEAAQAHNLFFILREADKRDHSVIYAPLPKRSGMGLALYNRMIRAAAHHIVSL